MTKSKRLNIFTIFLIAQVALAYFYGPLKLRSLLLLSYCAATMVYILKNRINYLGKADYYPCPHSYEANEETPTVLVLGKEIEPEGHENEKDDRYFRVTEKRYDRLILLFALGYIASTGFFLSEVREIFSEEKSSTIFLLFLFAIAPLTKAFGQLIILPFLVFILLLTDIDWNTLGHLDIFLFLFLALFFLYSAVNIVFYLGRDQKRIEYGNAIPFAALVSFLFVTIFALAPKPEVKGAPQKAKSHKYKKLQKLNKGLGNLKMGQKDSKLLQGLENFTKDSPAPNIGVSGITKQLETAAGAMEKAKGLLNTLPNIMPNIPEGERNILINENRQNQRDLKSLMENIRGKKTVNQKDIDDITKLLKTIDSHSKKMDHLLDRSLKERQLSNQDPELFKSIGDVSDVVEEEYRILSELKKFEGPVDVNELWKALEQNKNQLERVNALKDKFKNLEKSKDKEKDKKQLENDLTEEFLNSEKSLASKIAQAKTPNPIKEESSLAEDFKNYVDKEKVLGIKEEASYYDNEELSSFIEQEINNSPTLSPQEFNKKLNDKKKTLQEKKSLIDPKTLTKIFDFLKYILGAFVAYLIFQKVKGLFLGEEIDEDEELTDELSKADKKKLLIKRKYASIDEEMRILFLQLNSAVQKVLYSDQEPPPPALLKGDLTKEYPRFKKAHHYFLELFSQFEYNHRTPSNKELRNYRNAYRKIIKSL